MSFMRKIVCNRIDFHFDNKGIGQKAGITWYIKKTTRKITSATLFGYVSVGKKKKKKEKHNR